MLPRPYPSNDRPNVRAWLRAAMLLQLCATLLASSLSASTGWADQPMIAEGHLFRPVDYNEYDVMAPAAEDGALLGGQPFQDFSVQPPPRTFPNCRLPLLSWRLGLDPACAQYGPAFAPELPAHAVRKAIWYGATDVVALKRDPQMKRAFAQAGAFGAGIVALDTSAINYPFDAGGQFMLGHKITERLSFEATYLGSFEWSSQAAVRNNITNTPLGGTTTGVLSSPFTQFGLLGQQVGLDFNNLVSVNTFDRMESLDLAFRYRPDMPYGPYDVSFLYGLRYMATGETLHYHSESLEPAPGGSVNDVNVAADNDLIGAQLGITSHILILPSYWIDWDVKGALYNNHARQRTVWDQTTGGVLLASFANAGGKDITAGSLDVRVIGNFQLLPRLTLRGGYQATFVSGLATANSNFPVDLSVVQFGPSSINTKDQVVYHGPVLGIQWER